MLLRSSTILTNMTEGDTEKLALSKPLVTATKNNDPMVKAKSIEDDIIDEMLSSRPTKANGSSRWNKLSIVIGAATLFAQPRIEKISSARTLQQNILESTRSKSPTITPTRFDHFDPNSIKHAALREFGNGSGFYQALERGNEQDLEYIRQYIITNPKKHMFSTDDPNNILNRPNILGQSPLYIVSKNGHLKILKLLISMGANPYQLCKISHKIETSILEVASRWEHLEIVKYLLSGEFDWKRSQLKAAFKLTSNKMIKKLLKEKC